MIKFFSHYLDYHGAVEWRAQKDHLFAKFELSFINSFLTTVIGKLSVILYILYIIITWHRQEKCK